MNKIMIEFHIDGMSLYALYGNACLGMRHPGNIGESRIIAFKAIKMIGAYLVENGIITDEVRKQHEAGLEA